MTAESRDRFAARLRTEGLKSPRLASLARWVDHLPDARVARAIALIEIALDASRASREEALWLIDEHMRRPQRNLTPAVCVALLRWVVSRRVPRAKIAPKVEELKSAKSVVARDLLVETLDDEDGSVSLLNAHSIFAHAWRAAPAGARPRAVHRGELAPFIGARGAVRASVFVARRVEHLAAAHEENAKTFARLVSLAESAAASGKPPEPLAAAVDKATRDGVMSIARATCAEARATLRRPDSAGVAARPAAVKAVGLLLDAHGEGAVRTFLEALDEELRRLDVVHALFLRDKKASRPIARAIFRGGDAKGKGAVWLAALEGDAGEVTYGLLAKQGRLWTWTEGGRDEILATVSDAYFEQAAMAAKAVVLPKEP